MRGILINNHQSAIMAISKHSATHYARKAFVGRKHKTFEESYKKGVEWEQLKRLRERGRLIRIEKKRIKRLRKKQDEERQRKGVL